MRRFTRFAFGPLVATALGVLVGLACGDDAVEPEARPSEDELLEFYTDFCSHWEECEQSFTWADPSACANDQVDYYEKLPTGCLNRVVDYHRCARDLTCEKFNSATTDTTCRPARDAIANVDCGGFSAP